MSSKYLLDRRSTNSATKNHFGIFLLVWTITIIYAFKYGSSPKEFNAREENATEIFYDVLSSEGGTMLFRSFLCIMVGVLLIGALTLCTEFFVYLGVGTISIVTVSNSIFLIMSLTNLYGWLSLPINLPSTLVMIVVVYGIHKVRIQKIAEIVKCSAKACMSYPSFVVISIFLHLFAVLILGFTSLPFYYLSNIKRSDGSIPGIVFLIFIINLIGVGWIFFLIFDILHVTLAAAFTTWYKSENKCVSTSEMHRNAASSVRYHFGTLCYGSSISSLFSEYKAVINHRDEFGSINPNNQSKFRRFTCLLYILLTPRIFTTIAYNMTVINGTSFYKSAQRALSVVLSNPLVFLVVTYIASAIIGIVCLVLDLSILSDFISRFDVEDLESVVSLTVAAFFVTIGTSVVFTPFFTALFSITMCYLDDERENFRVKSVSEIPAEIVIYNKEIFQNNVYSID